MYSTTPQRLEQCRTAREAEALVWPVLDEVPESKPPQEVVQ